MTRRQLSLASKLYALAMVAHTETEGDTGDETRVRINATKRAKTALRRLGLDPADVISIDDCIERAQDMRP